VNALRDRPDAVAREPVVASQPGRAPDPKRALLLLVLNLLLVAVSAICGGLALVFSGQWLEVFVGLAAGLAYPAVLMTLHWLKWLIDIPAMLASDARWRLASAVLTYLSGLFASALVLGWLALVTWGVLGATPAWAALAWGYALVGGPLLLVLLRPAGYPLLVLLGLAAQCLYPIAWAMFHLAGLGMGEILRAIAVVTAVLPLVQFWPRWQSATRPRP
jgi:hypothetical protein